MAELITEEYRKKIIDYNNRKIIKKENLEQLKKFLTSNEVDEAKKKEFLEIIKNETSELNLPGKIPTQLKDCNIIVPVYHGDDRGYFAELFRKDTYKEHEFPEINQENVSLSSKGVVRGLHFQVGDYCQAKIVMALTGAVIDVVVDMRKGSPTYGKSTAVYLAPFNANDKSSGVQLYVPRGFAHGFISLKDNTLFNYRVDRPYNYDSEGGIYYNDPSLKIDWQKMFDQYEIEKPLLSDKDEPKTKEQQSKRKNLNETTNYFIYKLGNIDNMETDYDGVEKDYKGMTRGKRK